MLIWARFKKMIFLQMNYIKKYNNKMGGVNIDDKTSKYYRIYFWVMNRKWCWYIFFWAAGAILTNGYIIYICINTMNGTPRKHTLSHNCFRKEISCAWVNLENYSAGGFEVQPEIPAPRRKIKLDFYSSCLVSAMITDRAR